MVGLWIDLRPDGMRVAGKWQTVAVTEAEAEWWKTWSMTGDNNWWLGVRGSIGKPTRSASFGV